MDLEKTLYVIGDLHGCLNQLKQLHQFIQTDSQKREAPASILFLGDLIDRGPKNKETVEYVLKMMAEFKDSVLIMGNHDEQLLKLTAGIRSDIFDLDHWIYGLGGYQTMESYDDRYTDSSIDNVTDYSKEEESQYVFNVIKAQFPHHLELLQNAYYYRQIGGFVFVHAGIERYIPMKDQSEFQLVWIREGFLDNFQEDGRLVIHGHTPILTGRPEITSNRIGIDTCAFHIDILTCMVLDPSKRTMSFHQVDQHSIKPNQILPQFEGNIEAARDVFENPFKFEKIPAIDSI